MSVSQQGIEITNRFFQAIDILKQQKKIRSLRQITELYGLNYGNTHSLKTHPETLVLKPELIARLCLDYGISTEWIMFGIEPLFINQTTSKIRNSYKKSTLQTQ